MPKEATYTVAKDFTDMLGREWKTGQTFDGTKRQSVTQAAEEAGQISEDPPGPAPNEKLQRSGKVEPAPDAKVETKPPHDISTYGKTEP